MKDDNLDVDLLGKAKRRRRPKYEVALERHELAHVPARAERIRWLSTVIPEKTWYVMPMQSMHVFQEAKDCFVYGQIVAAQVLAASFVEHWLGALLLAKGQRPVVGRGLQAIVAACREQRILNDAVCDKVDALRLNRNPFVHLKPFNHEHSLGQRMPAARTHPDTLLEADAKQAMVAMYSVVRYSIQSNQTSND